MKDDELKTSGISKYIRPLIVIWLTALFSYLIISNAETRESYVKLLETITVVAYGSYFVGRSSEKIFAKKEKIDNTMCDTCIKENNYDRYNFEK